MDPLKTPAPEEAKLHFLDYWRIIRIRKTVILFVFLIVVITATVVTWFLPERYASKASIKIERDVTDVPGIDGQRTVGGIYDPYFIQTEFEVIQSELILDPVIERLNLNEVWQKKFNNPTKLKTSDTRAILKSMIELRPVRNTLLIDITVYSDNSQEAANIANAVAEVYSDYRQTNRMDMALNGIRAFQKIMAEEEVKIKDQEQKVETLRSNLSVIDVDPNSDGPGGSLGPTEVIHYRTQKIEAEATYIKEQKMLTELKGLPFDELKETIPTAAPDPILESILQNQLATETRLVTLLNDYGDQNPEVQRTLKLKDELDKQCKERVNGILIGLGEQVAAAKAVAENAQEKLDEAKTNDIALAESTHPYYVEKAELQRLKKFRDVLALRTFQEQTQVTMPTTSMVRVVNHAEPGKVPVRPNKPLNIALGIIIGLVVGVGLAFFIEYLDTSVKTIDDVERTLQAPVLGVIPQNVGYLFEEGAESPHAEAYRVLRTNLLFSRKDDKMNTVAVVSAGAGEGKSTTVCNLATVFAQSGQRVLMVDSDLRRPTLHKLMGVANNLGLTNYLLKQNTLEEVIQRSKQDNLDFMASGKLPSSSLGILSSAQMKDLIHELKLRYDFVFFDSPPIMGVSDASILASEVDMTLQVIQYRRYPQPMNIRAKQLIEKVGGNLLGIVLNNINMSQDESYYYYSGYYHDYYSKNEDEAATPHTNGAAGEKPRVDIKNKY
jgi:succinoglycan biosynthesis transport protein ExoP